MCIPLVGRVEVINHSLLIDYMGTSRLKGNQMLQQLNQSDFKMKIIKDLGTIKSNSSKVVRWAIFECSRCEKHITRRVADIKKNKQSMCKPCVSKDASSTHGLSKTKLYRTWAGMVQRCYNLKSKDFDYYGGRGITICDEWRNDFKKFYEWAYSNGYKDGLTIDRIENNIGYVSSNCRFTDRIVQARNTRKSKNNTSGYIGVTKNGSNYQGRITMNSKRIVLARGTALECAIARDKYIIDNNLEHTLNGVING